MPAEKYKLFDSLLEGVMVLKKDWKCVYVNSSAIAQTGFSKEEMHNNTAQTLFPAMVGTEMEDFLRSGLMDGKSSEKEVVIPYEEDKYRWYDLKIRPIEEGLLIMMIDITARKRAEYEKVQTEIKSRELHDSMKLKQERRLKKFNKRLKNKVAERTKELLEALEREKALHNMKADFLSMVSHELKAPLASINVCMDVIRKTESISEDPALLKYGGYIKEEVANMLKMVTEFVSPTNEIMHHTEEDKESIMVDQFVDGILVGLRELTRKDQDFVHTHVGDVKVIINQDILRRIVLNLLSNAMKYSKNDIIINTSVKNNKLKIIISDTGIGISEKDQDELFSKFFRAENAKEISGTGLGLHIVKTYVDMLGGEIVCKSVLDKGTSFEVLLPV